MPVHKIDLRIVRIGVEVNGLMKFYSSPLGVVASGTRYANKIQNECEVKIYNLDKETLNYILTETSPFNKNKTPKRVVVEAGRESYGVAQIFSGNIISSTPTQPPEIGIVLKCLTGNFKKGDVISASQPGSSKLSTISKQTAQDLELDLDFQADDTDVTNYNYSGSSLNQIDSLGTFNNIDAFVDNDTLIVKNSNSPLKNTLTVVSEETGMIGIPELTEQGIKVTFFLDGQTTLGGRIRVESKIYPSTNGEYIIYKLGFDVASRENQFFWIAEAKRL